MFGCFMPNWLLLDGRGDKKVGFGYWTTFWLLSWRWCQLLLLEIKGAPPVTRHVASIRFANDGSIGVMNFVHCSLEAFRSAGNVSWAPCFSGLL